MWNVRVFHITVSNLSGRLTMSYSFPYTTSLNQPSLSQCCSYLTSKESEIWRHYVSCSKTFTFQSMFRIKFNTLHKYYCLMPTYLSVIIKTAPADPQCAFTGHWYFCTDMFSTRLESTKKMKQAQEARTFTDKSNLSPRILGGRWNHKE